jgi:hypothetical protein
MYTIGINFLQRHESYKTTIVSLDENVFCHSFIYDDYSFLIHFVTVLTLYLNSMVRILLRLIGFHFGIQNENFI